MILLINEKVNDAKAHFIPQKKILIRVCELTREDTIVVYLISCHYI
jgi:hypothetical protein